MDSQGTVHTASVDPSQFGSQDGVEYTVFAAGWQVENIGSGPIVYEFGTSIAVNNLDRPGITYYDDRKRGLKYAHRSPDGEWTIVAVDEDGNTGKFSSLAYEPRVGITSATLSKTAPQAVRFVTLSGMARTGR